MYFNTNLAFVRKQKKVSQLELAKKIGVDQSTISLWEKGMDTTVENATKVAEALDVPIPDFLGRDLRMVEENTPNEHDEKIKQLETDTGVKISYASDKELTNEDYLAINELVLEVLKEQKDDKK